jgi:hypothetical protein
VLAQVGLQIRDADLGHDLIMVITGHIVKRRGGPSSLWVRHSWLTRLPRGLFRGTTGFPEAARPPTRQDVISRNASPSNTLPLSKSPGLGRHEE